MRAILSSRGFAFWYLGVGVGLAALHPLLPFRAQPVLYFLISWSALGALGVGLACNHGPARRPWQVLFCGMVVLNLGNAVDQYYLYVEHRPSSDGTITGLLFPIGQVLVLATALLVVVRRGRDDFGGVIDAAIVALATAGVVWDGLLLPHLSALHAPVGIQVPIFVDILLMAGVFGALVRVWRLAREPIRSLQLFVAGLLVTLVGLVVVTLTADPVTGQHPTWSHGWYLMSQVLVGAAALHPSSAVLTRPDSVPRDQLSRGRLFLLSLALAADPLIGAGRALLGQPVDALLLMAGSAIVVPLVMLRIGQVTAQRERAERALTYQAAHDALTGLPNRRAFVDHLERALEAFQAGTAHGLSVLFCDLDGFKAVNDNLGHAAGDLLLAEVAHRLSQSIREGDMLSRFGGDEFLIMCVASHPAQTAADITERITEELSRPFDLAGHEVRVGASVGAVTAGPDTDTDTIISRADEAMYQAKQDRKLDRSQAS